MVLALVLCGLGVGCAALVWLAWGLYALHAYFESYDGYHEE